MAVPEESAGTKSFTTYFLNLMCRHQIFHCDRSLNKCLNFVGCCVCRHSKYFSERWQSFGYSRVLKAFNEPNGSLEWTKKASQCTLFGDTIHIPKSNFLKTRNIKRLSTPIHILKLSFLKVVIVSFRLPFISWRSLSLRSLYSPFDAHSYPDALFP
jgi:hypothetical protein